MLTKINKLKNFMDMQLSLVENLPLSLVLDIPLDILFTHSKTYKNTVIMLGIIIVRTVNKTPLRSKFVSINVTVNPNVKPFNDKITRVIGEKIMFVLNKIKITIGTTDDKNDVCNT